MHARRSFLIAGIVVAIGCGDVCPGGVFEGDYAIGTSSDAKAIVGCTTVTGSVIVSNNPALAILSLPMLTTVGDEFMVSDNPALASLSLPMLTTVSAEHEVIGNTSFNAGFSVRDNPALTSLSLPMLTTVGIEHEVDVADCGCAASFIVTNNPALTSLSLPSLATVSGYLYVKDNAALTTLSLPVLTTVSGSAFYVYGNTALKACLAEAVLDQLIRFTGNTSIFGNNGAGTCP